MKPTKGFTLIELVVVIVILGILAATALPKFVDLYSDTYRAVVNDTAGQFRSAMNLGNAKWRASGQTGAVQNLPGYLNGTVDFTATGWPVDTAGRTDLASDNLHSTCINVWNTLLQNPPTIMAYNGDNFPANYDGWCVDAQINLCVYAYMRDTSKAKTCGSGAGNVPGNMRGFMYDVTTGAFTVQNP